MRKVKNRRKHPRSSGQGIVTYRRSIMNRGLLKEVTGQGQLQNLSGGGLCLLTEQRLAPKQLLTIRVPTSYPKTSIPTLAYTQWTRSVRGTARYAAGLSFLV